MAEQKREQEVIFFFGAGASVDAGVPTTFEFVKHFKQSLENHPVFNLTQTFENVEKVLMQWVKERKESAGIHAELLPEKVDIELLMEALDRLSMPDEEFLLKFYTAFKNPVGEIHDVKELLERLKDFIKEKCAVGQDRIRYLEHLLGFIQDYQPLDIFSVNYDICIEQFCHVYKKSYTDGFDVDWNPTLFERADLDVRLYKIHGSIKWYQTNRGSYIRTLIDTGKGQVKLRTGEIAEPLMLYPMRKWEYVEPLLENLVALKRRLEAPSCKYVIVVGYSFRDEQIRRIFFDAATRNKSLRVILIDPSAQEIYDRRLRNYAIKVIPDTESPLARRVICLPYQFENILPVLKNVNLSNLRDYNGLERDLTRRELSGQFANWEDALKPLLYSEHMEKYAEIIKTKIPYGRQIEDFEKFASSTSSDKFPPRNYDLLFWLEQYIKRGLYFLANDNKWQYKSHISNLIALYEVMLIKRMALTVERNRIHISFNHPYSYTPEVLADRLLQLSGYIHAIKFSRINEKMNPFYILVDDLGTHLSGLNEKELEITPYVTSRSEICPEKAQQLRQLGISLNPNVFGEPLDSTSIERQLAEVAKEIEKQEITIILEQARHESGIIKQPLAINS
jgi:hypothetical protein